MIIKDTKLEKHIDVNLAESFFAPNLIEAWDIYADSAEKFSAPKLKEASNIFVQEAKSFSAPNLKKSMGYTCRFS